MDYTHIRNILDSAGAAAKAAAVRKHAKYDGKCTEYGRLKPATVPIPANQLTNQRHCFCMANE